MNRIKNCASLMAPGPLKAGSSAIDASDALSFDPIIEKHLGEKLRSAYADVLTEPIPQRFLDLLDALATEDDAS